MNIGLTVNVKTTNESHPPAEVNTSVNDPPVVRVCVPKIYESPSQIKALAVSLSIGLTVNVNTTVESHPPVELNNSVNDPPAVNVCVPKTYESPLQIETLADSLKIELTITST